MECNDLREKTEKVGIIARACTIYKVTRIYIYHDLPETHRINQRLISILLQYTETPQYLRKHLFPKMPELASAGVLPPLRAPHHAVQARFEDVRVGMIREGFCYTKTGTLYVDVGLSLPAQIEGSPSVKKRVTVQITSTHPLTCKVIDRNQVEEYWGFTVKQSEGLGKLIRSLMRAFVIATSKNGVTIDKKWREVIEHVRLAQRCLLLFGSPRRGLFEIAKDQGESLEELADVVLNVIPEQGTVTVRTEEAMHATLAIVNLINHLEAEPIE
jgi:predicted SPOUT superfamily RNA methylase MTH1